MELTLWIIVGFISGTVAGAVVPGRSPGGWLGAVSLGIAGGLLGGWVAKAFGLGDTVTWLGSLGVALLGSIVILFFFRPDRSNSSA